ncbi:Beclin-1 [Tyrophagus putrescentiae]|nr:Beclin-1 [Tyrophagus putrescentiae]
MEEHTIDVHFSCQRCCQPLRLDKTLNPMSKDYYYDLITNSAQTTGGGGGGGGGLSSATTTQLGGDGGDRNRKVSAAAHTAEVDEVGGETGSTVKASSSVSSSPVLSSRKSSTITNTTTTTTAANISRMSPDVITKTIEPIRKTADYDYSLINDPSSSNITSTTSFIHSSLMSNHPVDPVDGNKDLKLQIQLFDILSDQSDIDHPLCEECADFVIKQMDHHLKILEDECADYNEYLKQIDTTKQETTAQATDEEEIEELRTQLKSMQLTQASMIAELKELNKEQKRVEDDVEKNLNELKRLKTDEDRYWHEYNNVKYNFFQCEEEQSTLENKLRYAKTFYGKLKSTCVFNATFHIWHSGDFATINGFRMGRLESMQVDWNEINAGWGQCALLLSSLANKIGLTFKRFKIVPYGNYSFIESLEADKSKQLPLYTSGGLKYYFNQKYDQAMVAFLDCLKQFNDECHRQDEGFKLPYEMDLKGNISDLQHNIKLSIKISINTEDKWTKALKLMLTNLKWGLAFVSNKHHV